MSQPQINMQRVYLKGASLELPGAPESFLAAGPVELHNHLDLHIASKDLGQSNFEVSVRATLTLTRQGPTADEKKTFAVIEAEQSGVFTLQDVPEQDVLPVLSIGCAQALFPYLRVNVADLMTRSTLQPFHLPDVNFAAMFQQVQAAQAEQAAKAANDGTAAAATVH